MPSRLLKASVLSRLCLHPVSEEQQTSVGWRAAKCYDLHKSKARLQYILQGNKIRRIFPDETHLTVSDLQNKVKIWDK